MLTYLLWKYAGDNKDINDGKLLPSQKMLWVPRKSA